MREYLRGVVYRGGEGRRSRVARQLAEPLRAVAAGGTGIFKQGHLPLRRIERRRHQIGVHMRRRIAPLRVHAKVFDVRPAESLKHAACQLSFRLHRIYRAPYLRRDRRGERCRLVGVHVKLYFHGVRYPGVAVIGVAGELFLVPALPVVKNVIAERFGTPIFCQILPGRGDQRRAGERRAAVLYRHFKVPAGVLHSLAHVHRGAGGDGRAGIRRASGIRLHIDDVVNLDPQRLGGHHRQHRRGPLPHLRAARIYTEFISVKSHLRRRSHIRLAGAGKTASVEAEGDADAPAETPLAPLREYLAPPPVVGKLRRL
ncbi:hypothetical protein SDC9_92025 [bioreactor metagenome]|uniref:Uncharacterized protein n=1 Tax=bioreactor metagenome TaxID=1076179 RepID=A0A644ZY34_9ZZZZ